MSIKLTHYPTTAFLGRLPSNAWNGLAIVSMANFTSAVPMPESRPFGISSATETAKRTWKPTAPVAIWATLDVVTVLAAGAIVLVLHPGNGAAMFFDLANRPHGTLLAFPIYLAVFSAYLMLCSRLHGLYPQDLNQSGLHEQRMTVQATMTAALLLCGTLYLFHAYSLPRMTIMLIVGLALAMLMARRAIWRRRIKRRYLEGLETRNVLIVGEGRVARALRTHLEALRHMGFRFKGFVSQGARDGTLADREVVGDVDNCVAIARSLFVDEIYVATSLDRHRVISVAQQAHSMGIDVRVVPDLYDGLAWNTKVEYIGQFPTIPLGNHSFPHGAFLAKRAMDVAFSCAALVLLWPLLACIAVAILVDSPGPILYRAERIGHKGRKFSCLKFRTMVANADQRRTELAHLNERKSVLFKIANDPRVSAVGAFLRKYSLDELPQLVNVLRGEMSLVGPRPPMAAEVEQYQLPHLRRLDVLPGMTGLWQVEARQDPSFDSYISLDTAYVENWNLLLDMRILARTVGVVFSGTGS